jgi:hypothetical protein
MTPSKRSPLMYNRVVWAAIYLRKAAYRKRLQQTLHQNM